MTAQATPASFADARDLPPLPPEPTDRAALAAWLREHLGLNVPDIRVCPDHQTPMDYLAASFLDAESSTPKRGASRVGDLARSADLLVWANRGGGKTMLAAVASLLEAIYRAPVAVRILGGSFDQSDRLAEHLRNFLDTPLGEALSAKVTRERIVLANKADIRMLAQSERAVRGQHVQRIRCDELELFDAKVWRALQFVTRSTDRLRGSVEVFSTMHRADGLMTRAVEQARNEEAFRLFNWCLWEVIETCPPSRPCQGCPLADDCAGKARRAEGFFRIDDAIAIKNRSSKAAWQSEMLCMGPRREGQVFAEFERDLHVADVAVRAEPIYCGVDFGYNSPFVCLWMQRAPDNHVRVLDEYVCVKRTAEIAAREVLRRTAERFGRAAAIENAFVDPSGAAAEGTSGASWVDMLTAGGIPCSYVASRISDGIELIRTALAPAVGLPRLTIDPRCIRLIEAFENYHYPDPGESDKPDKPVKDGPDHCMDALRYFFIGRMRPGQKVKTSSY